MVAAGLAGPDAPRAPCNNVAVAFRLRKYYFDLVAESGDALIAFWASLRWGPLRLRYAAVDVFRADGSSESASGIGSAPPIESHAGAAWDASTLRLTGRWRTLVPSFSKTLLESGGRSVRWRCLAPAAEASLRVGDREFVGPGYAECLDLTIEPWRLPIDTLRWGRIAEPDRQAVWIAWDGPQPLRLLVVDGRDVEAAAITDRRIAWSAGEFGLDPLRTLRDARLDEGALRGLPRLLARTPLRMLAAHERKVVSRVLEDGAIRSRFALHETVRFPSPGGDPRDGG